MPGILAISPSVVGVGADVDAGEGISSVAKLIE